MGKNEIFFEKIWRVAREHAIMNKENCPAVFRAEKACAEKPQSFRRKGNAMTQSAKWKVIHMARSEKHANEILALLSREGILARSRQVYRTVSSEENYYEIMVLNAEAVEAQQLLIENNLLL